MADDAAQVLTRVHAPWPLDLDSRRARRELEKVHLGRPDLAELARHELRQT